MLVVGLTGGIGSGKSAAAQRFADLGAPVIDTDRIAREIVEPGQPGLRRIEKTFGKEVLDEHGRLRREYLRRIVFHDPARRMQLESLLHPLIRDEALRRIEALDMPYCVVVVPLLVETDFTTLVDRVLVVDTPLTLQIERVANRDGLSEEEIRAILAAQTGREERLAAADDVIVNNRDLKHLERQVDALHEHYLRLARRHG
jgi:dephospho-CoA kinase